MFVTVRTALYAAPAPADEVLGAHRTRDALVHAVVVQIVSSTELVGVGLFPPKLIPCNVTLPPPVEAMFVDATILTTGESKENLFKRVPTRSDTVTTKLSSSPPLVFGLAQ
jgi:hypothetical protein